MNLRHGTVMLLALGVLTLAAPSPASAAQTRNAPNPGPASGGQSTASEPQRGTVTHGNGNCPAGSLVLNALNPFSHCNLGSQTANGVGQVPGDVAGAAGAAAAGLTGDVMNQVTTWMVQAAQTVDGDVMNAATATTTPELTAPWYQTEFAYLAYFAAALAGLVALLGVISAGIRGDAGALGDILYGILRAGLVTAMVVSLTLLALDVADGISADVVQHMPKQFFHSLAAAWGAKGWGGLASSALAFVTSLTEVAVAVLLWIELLFRDAAIYIAVLFFPFTLAMAIWPRLAGTHSKLIRTLGIFIAFKPAALIIMMTGANLLLGGVSFIGGVGPSVGTILAGLAVLAMAAFAPWALLHLVGLDSGVMGSASSGRSRARSGSGPGDGSGGGGPGSVGGDLFAGRINYGGGATRTLGGGGAGSPGVGGARMSASPAGSSGGGRASNIRGETGRRIVPGPIAAAAGLLPAGFAAAATVVAGAQTLAEHGAARVHAAAGHGASRPPLPSFSSGSSSRNGSTVNGSQRPPTGERTDASFASTPAPDPAPATHPGPVPGSLNHLGTDSATPRSGPGSPGPLATPPDEPPDPFGREKS
jgi:type IV secretion system protein TrbL